jgi:hypothetical protein
MTNDKSEALRKEFNEKLDALKGEGVEKEGGWIHGDAYYLIDVENNILNSKWVNDDIDSNRAVNGNAFRTREKAEKELLRRKMRAGAYLPNHGEEYWTVDELGSCFVQVWISSGINCLAQYFAGFTRKTEEEMEEAFRLYGKGFEL